MASSQSDVVSLPPLDLYNLVGIWISTLLYGANIILFSLCLYVLLRKKPSTSIQWPLLLTSCILFILATAHIAASLRQLLDSFINAPRSGVQDAGLLYWASAVTTKPEKLKSYYYTIIVGIQDIILIWRLYVVWANNWKVIIPPTLLELTRFVIYSIEILVNVGATAGIAGRLWYMGRQHEISTLSSASFQRHNPYITPILTIVESGAIFTVSTIVVLAMMVADDFRVVGVVDVAVQLAALSPLLIIVRVNFGLTHSIGSKTRGPVHIGRIDTRGAATSVSSFNACRALEADAIRTPSCSYDEDGNYPLRDMSSKPASSQFSY